MSADGLAQLGASTSAGTVMKQVWEPVDTPEGHLTERHLTD